MDPKAAAADGSGAVKTSYAYEPYGNTTTRGEVNTNAVQYAAGNDAAGLYYYRARYYHPGFGRFVTEDPIGQSRGANVYAYVDGDPISYIDPDGNSPRSPRIICIVCGARHGGTFGPYCPDCYTKSKEPDGGVPPRWEPPSLPTDPPEGGSCKNGE
jgi:RHS repeat-associated protein